VSDLAHWECWGSHGELEHVNKPVPNSTPEAAMDELLSKARFVSARRPPSIEGSRAVPSINDAEG
jgi:hypothetical protein